MPRPVPTATDHVLVFDEAYYVNAARVIAGIARQPGAHYAGAPLGDDPNAEHPQLAKLVIAGLDRAVRRRAVRVAARQPRARVARDPGDVRAGARRRRRAAGSRSGAAALMAADNLLLVHGRIGTLDIYAVAAMIWGAALYLRGRPLLAGVVIGVGACYKLVAPYVLLVAAAVRAARVAVRRGGDRRELRRLRDLRRRPPPGRSIGAAGGARPDRPAV